MTVSDRVKEKDRPMLVLMVLMPVRGWMENVLRGLAARLLIVELD